MSSQHISHPSPFPSGASTPSAESSSSSYSSPSSTPSSSSPSSSSTSIMRESDTSTTTTSTSLSSDSTTSDSISSPSSFTSTPTPLPIQGHPTSANPHHVLLLLDIQQAMLAPPPIGIPNAPQVHVHLTDIITRARSAPFPKPLIVHVRNAGDIGEPDEPNSQGWDLIFPPTQAQLECNEIIVDKRKNNAFAGTNLGEVIPTNAEIVVAGFQTDYSIRATCSAALGRGNEVLLIRGAHATYDRIEVLHGGGITPAHRIEAEIEAELEEAGVHLLEMKDVPGLFVGR